MSCWLYSPLLWYLAWSPGINHQNVMHRISKEASALVYMCHVVQSRPTAVGLLLVLDLLLPSPQLVFICILSVIVGHNDGAIQSTRWRMKWKDHNCFSQTICCCNLMWMDFSLITMTFNGRKQTRPSQMCHCFKETINAGLTSIEIHYTQNQIQFGLANGFSRLLAKQLFFWDRC